MLYDDGFLHNRDPIQIGWRYGTHDAGGASITPAERQFMQLPPELLFASDCFQAIYARKNRQHVCLHPLVTALPQFTVLYTGERLDQFDLDVLLACLRITQRAVPVKGMVRISLRELAQKVSRSVGKTVQARVRASLRRLEAGTLHISDARYEFLFSFLQQVMISRENDLCLVAVHPMLLDSMNAIPRLNLKIRDRGALAADGLLRWLHALSHCGSEMCIPQAMLPELSGSRALPRSRVETAMATLADTGCRHYLGLTDTQDLFLCLR
ncbi:hypothetical protein [Desulfovibrio psychrotolerans]|uniref:Uncharacterized protein n=1 Tax=Desulfovibrio psychrotolerans TaxID=415242 RepID=A0A7J0BWI9_9BACT|nr:hypothetical protein [Desulfovibrio psychrotolerans]GFM38063.1 hypothetical protein DSM19430T_27470 [Desulfovibrio psychrotolerans]